MDLEAGTRIGPYEILSEIGGGGMGTVYLAHDTRLHRHVALKFIHAELAADEHAAVTRLLHEARAASALNHPNICHVYDVGGEGAESWIAMEYVEGQPLSTLIGRGGLPIHEVARLGIQIAEGLAHAHARGILHRDLKSANIACDTTGRIKILDFGLARRMPHDVAQELSTTTAPDDSAFAGTLAYMPPEVVRGEGLDERSDLWSFGVVLFEMATGARPFEGRTIFDVAAAIVRDPPRELPRTIPAGFRDIVMRLLAKSPSARYGTAAEVAAALELVSKGETRGARRWSSRRALAALGLAAGVGAIALLLWMRGSSRPMTITQQRLLSEVEAGHGSPAYSPDGSRIAYTAPDAAGVEQIWVRNVAGGASIQVTHETAPANRPRWMPNDRLLYSVAGRGLWVIPTLGGAPTRLLEQGENPDVSRDGTRIVFETRTAGDRLLWTAAADGSDVRKISGTAVVYYNVPMMPALSPDGSQVAYFHAAAGPNGDVSVIPSTGGTSRQLTFDLREGSSPVWTPDGKAIVFSSARAGSRTLWQIPAGGGQPAPLTTGAGEDDQPAISMDGRHLAYTNVRNTWELKTRDLSSGEERTLIKRSLEVLFPMFSPDGQRITFFGRADEAVAIFVVGRDGKNQQQLTGGKELNHQPRWSADGTEIYFFQVVPNHGLRRMPSVGGPSRDFRPWEWQTHSAPYFDPTGRFIAYTHQRAPRDPSTRSEHTVIHEMATGNERQWPEPHTHPTGWLPAGDSIVGWQHHPAGGDPIVVICTVANGSCRPVTRGRIPKWSAADNRVYFVKSEGRVQQLWSVAPDGSDARSVAPLGTFRTIDLFFDVSRDGLVAWAPFHGGQKELWTASLSER